MKFVINTVIEPHFCCLFDEENKLIDSREWTNKRRDGVEIFTFCTHHDISSQNITFLGGVSGPGGFSSLRVASCILTAFSVKFGIPIHQVRADTWAKKFLGISEFFLNTFGKAVWHIPTGKLERIEIESANELYASQKKFLGFLPPEKQALLTNIIPLDASVEEKESSLLESLLETKSQELFVPEYEYPAVQKNS